MDKLCPVCYANGKETLIREEDLVCSEHLYIGGKFKYLEVDNG
jgi:hypothetical protein